MRVLFVCSGNTCRSPLAEVIASTLFGSDGRRSFESAGIDAVDQAPASRGAVAVALECGLDLSGHRSRRVTKDMIARADEVYAMTTPQLETLVRLDSAAALEILLLDPSGAEIADPAGGDLQRYRRTRDHLRRAIEARFG
jgi:protein-tyrosine-phosphatase